MYKTFLLLLQGATAIVAIFAGFALVMNFKAGGLFVFLLLLGAFFLLGHFRRRPDIIPQGPLGLGTKEDGAAMCVAGGVMGLALAARDLVTVPNRALMSNLTRIVYAYFGIHGVALFHAILGVILIYLGARYFARRNLHKKCSGDKISSTGEGARREHSATD